MKYSFIIPTYNRAYCIKNTLESIFNQQTKDYEIVIIDDASIDNTYESISEFINLGNVNYIRLIKNGGVNVARNVGISEARGEWLILLDSDDFLTKNGLSDINKVIEERHHLSSVFMFACINLDGELTVNTPEYTGLLYAKQYFNEKIQGEYFVVVRRDVLIKFPFEEKIRGGEGITWKKIIIKYPFFISNIPSRIYNNLSDDRLSYKTSNFYLRVFECHLRDLKVHFLNYLRFSPVSLVKLISKVVVYRIFLILK